MTKRSLPASDKPLGDPKLAFEETFSAEKVVLDTYFPDKGLTNQKRDVSETQSVFSVLFEEFFKPKPDMSCPVCRGLGEYVSFGSRMEMTRCGCDDDRKELSDDQKVMELLQSDSPLNRARKVFSAEAARIEQECSQRNPPSSIEMRKMEFLAVKKILNAFGKSE